MSVINIFHKDGEVWLDTEVTERDGLCIGSGGTVAEAIEEARTNLLDALRQLSEAKC